jgi:hypothetical protein
MERNGELIRQSALLLQELSGFYCISNINKGKDQQALVRFKDILAYLVLPIVVVAGLCLQLLNHILQLLNHTVQCN